MQKQLTITYGSGDMATVVAYPPDFAKWERAEKKSIREFSGIFYLWLIQHLNAKQAVSHLSLSRLGWKP